MLKPDSLEIRNIYVYSISKGLLSLSLPLGIQALINFIQGGKISTSWVLLVFFSYSFCFDQWIISNFSIKDYRKPTAENFHSGSV